jgi:hypothetical protein
MATKMYGDRFRSIKELTEIYKNHGMGLIDAENTAKREIKKKYKTQAAYDKAKAEYKESSRLEKGENRLIEQIEHEYIKAKNAIHDPMARKFYNQAYRRYLTTFKDLNIADHYARVDLERYCHDNKLEINTLNADQILTQIGVDNPNMDLTSIQEYQTIIDSMDSGMSFKESYDLAVRDTVLFNTIDKANNDDMSNREKTFKKNLSIKDLEFANSMKILQPDMSWTYEKVYRMNHDEEEVNDVINDIPKDRKNVNIDNLPSIIDIANELDNEDHDNDYVDSDNADYEDNDSDDEDIDDTDYDGDEYDDVDYEYE